MRAPYPVAVQGATDVDRIDLPPGSLRRSVALLRAFRVEQTQPDVFYRLLARDSVRQVGEYAPIAGGLVVDVGGGPGYFADEFQRAGARYVAIDSDLGELSARGAPAPGTVIGSGMALPVRDRCVDMCYSSNVLEHVAQPERMAEEMARVTRPGGIVFLSYTTWLSPWGGHETAPWHYLGGAYAARRYERRYGHRPKNRYGETLFPLSAGRMLRWARGSRSVDVVDALPRYHPRWVRWVTRVPGVREVAAWNLVLVLRRR
jgi:SAM-dependent methyltransferase